MLTKRVRLQLVAFAVIAVVAIVYAAFRFTDIGRVFGADGYTVKMNLNESGGIFTNAEVTYRGYNVGRVGEIHLTREGIAGRPEHRPGRAGHPVGPGRGRGQPVRGRRAVRRPAAARGRRARTCPARR